MPDSFSTTITSCSFEQKADLTQSSCAQSLELSVHSAMAVRAKLHNHSTVVALIGYTISF
jgi:hypothetical protein